MEKLIRGDEVLIPEIADISDRDGEMIADGLSSLTLYLTFLLGNDTFGIQVGEIREVIEYKKVFKVPGVPDFIKGVINLRGEVVPVIDLHSRFYNKPTDVINSTSIIVVEVNDENYKIPVGVMIDSVEAVTGLPVESIETVPEIGSKIRTDFIHGIGKVEDQFVILLKVQNILNLKELSDTDINLN
jgi:purine-binding chemotaxis protein CheW